MQHKQARTASPYNDSFPIIEGRFSIHFLLPKHIIIYDSKGNIFLKFFIIFILGYVVDSSCASCNWKNGNAGKIETLKFFENVEKSHILWSVECCVSDSREFIVYCAVRGEAWDDSVFVKIAFHWLRYLRHGGQRARASRAPLARLQDLHGARQPLLTQW